MTLAEMRKMAKAAFKPKEPVEDLSKTAKNEGVDHSQEAWSKPQKIETEEK